MPTVLVAVLALNALLHVLSVGALRRRGAPASQVNGVAAFAAINAALAVGVALGARWALWGALAFPLVGGAALLVQSVRARSVKLVDLGILVCDAVAVTLSSILLFA